eukprot:TRINITY_DN15100_c0_g1_i1.p1 TRINITY_DN15100_c0_g1~~TRINITY_DN15100_c0_g1_i1.p1  ORF type:complete len:480 (+),score=120.76 TRINITY_DN15100_c0_g1_i1:139-1440(+)
MPLKQKTSGTTGNDKKRKKEKEKGSGKKQKIAFDYLIKDEGKAKEEGGTLVVKATVHGDVCDFDDEGKLGETAHLASGADLEDCLGHLFSFLKDEGELKVKPTRMKRFKQSVCISLPSKSTDYTEMLKYRIRVLLPVALMDRCQTASMGYPTPSPRKGRDSAVSKESIDQLHKKIEELTTLRLREVSQLQEEKILLQEREKHQKVNLESFRSMERERDQLLAELREQTKEIRDTQREINALRLEKNSRIEAGMREMEDLKTEKAQLEIDIAEQKKVNTVQFAELSARLAKQVTDFEVMIKKQKDQLQNQMSQNSTPVGTPQSFAISYVLDPRKYPLGCRLRAEPQEDSKYHTSKTTGEPVIVPPQTLLFFCNSRHNGFSKVRTATGPAGYIRSKYLQAINPATPTPATPAAVSSPGSYPTPSQPVFTENDAGQ